MTDEQRAELEEAGRDLVAADEMRGKALDRIAAAMKAAEGTVPIREMARLAGVSHVTAYRLLERTEAKS